MPIPLLQIGSLSNDDLRRRLESVPPGESIDCNGVKRLPLAVLIAARDHGMLTFANVHGPARSTLTIFRLPIADAHPSFPEVPFLIETHAPDTLVIKPKANATTFPNLSSHPGHDWLQGLTAGSITIDLTAVQQINSVVVAWMLRLAQDSAPLRLKLSKVSRQVETQLRQLRLDHILAL